MWNLYGITLVSIHSKRDCILSSESARLIQQSGEFKCGRTVLVGDGIYVATSDHHTGYYPMSCMNRST